jgi:hypothetical protein
MEGSTMLSIQVDLRRLGENGQAERGRSGSLVTNFNFVKTPANAGIRVQINGVMHRCLSSFGVTRSCAATTATIIQPEPIFAAHWEDGLY